MSAPAESNVEVAVAPKYDGPYEEKRDVDALPNVARPVCTDVPETTSEPAKVLVAVEVAVKYPAVAELPRRDDPSTANAAPGVVVPMPMNPAFVMRYTSVPAALLATKIG